MPPMAAEEEEAKEEPGRIANKDEKKVPKEIKKSVLKSAVGN